MDANLLQLERKTAQLRAVGEITAALAAALDLEETLTVITRVTSQVMRVDSCSIYLQDETDARLVLKATTGLAREALGHVSLKVGEGLTGWAVIHGQPVAARDAIHDPRFKLLPETHEESLKSLLAVPLNVLGRSIGAINVQTVQVHEYTDDEQELLSMIANLAAGALEKAALHDRMQRQIQELSALAQVSRTVTSPLYLDEMLGVVTEMAARIIGAKAIALHLLDEVTHKLVLRAAHNTNPAGRKINAIPFGHGIVGLVAATGQPLIVRDVRTDERYLNRALAEREGLVSLLSVPLIVRDRTVGVFTCYMGTPHDFDAKEVELVQTLANQTALAIENARLVINSAIVREMHHRVKNNLQMIGMILRLQMSSARDLRAEDILAETINRILSIAAVHEMLSDRGMSVVDVKDVLERVTRSIAETMLTGGRGITLTVDGDPLSLASREATSLALATSELVQNSVKHAFVGREGGNIRVILQSTETENKVIVEDDGVGDVKSLGAGRGLGLEIVQTLVKDDLKGKFEIASTAHGTQATISFPNTGVRLEEA